MGAITLAHNIKQNKLRWIFLVFILSAALTLQFSLIKPKESNAGLSLAGALALGAAVGAISGILAEITKAYRSESYELTAEGICDAAVIGALKGVFLSLVIFAVKVGAAHALVAKFGLVSIGQIEWLIDLVESGANTVISLYFQWEDIDPDTEQTVLGKIQSWVGDIFPCLETLSC
ncbi:MAG: hypothetical protein WAN36_10335, partial [Calditrichia bacterium]